ncbi:MAG: ComEC/Rec2 family competence protein [Actinobacteria bacterium]|nr:ComEC/Rec2 family competence protein [Actinomycetota bacterium]
MLRRVAPLHVFVAAYCCGLCLTLAVRPPWWCLLAGVAGLAAAMVVALRRGSSEHSLPALLLVLPAGLAAMFLIAGVAVGGSRLDSLGHSTMEAFEGRFVTISAVLTDLPAAKDDQVTLAVAVKAVNAAPLAEPAHLRLRLEDGERFVLDSCGALVEGAVVEVDSVHVEPLPSPKPGAFDYGRYLRRRGEHVTLEGRFADLRVSGRRGGLQGAVDCLRLASRAHLRAGVHGPVGEVLQGMVLGDDEGVDQGSIDDFRRSGLLHIMAVSGENVILLCSMWAFAFSLLGIPRLVRTTLLVPVVATYVLLTGASPSIVRAGVSGIVGLLAVLASRPTDGWLLWLVPAAWLLTRNPNTIFDVSFQLSFGAVAGLLLLARPLTRLFGFLPGPLPQQVGITTAASLSTAPVSMITFGSASLVSVPANLAGGFVLGPIMFVGMLSLLLGFVSSWLSAPLNVVAGLFIGFLMEVSRLFGRLPFAVYEWRGVGLRLLLLVAFCAELTVVVVLARRAGGGLAAYVRDRRRRAALVAATAGLAAAVLLLAPLPAAPPRQPTLTFLDVGEGAATLFQAPGGPTVLIDAGPAPLARTLRAHAVKRIDLLVLSHGHADHVAGLADVVGSIPITTALLPRPPSPSAALEAIAARLTAAGTEVRRCETPVEVTGAGWGLRVLPTSPPEGESGNQSENDTALVVLADLGGRYALVPGDAEGDVLEALDLPVCTVVELPHHGSRGGLDDAQLDELAPSLAVISVGPNTYGHPTPEMLTLLTTGGVACARTDQRGEVTLTAAARGLEVRVSRGG